MLKITERLKVKILNDGILDTDESFQKAQWLIDIINRAECEHEEGRSHQILLDDKELESLQSPFPDSDLKKAIQALKNGGVDLNNLVDYEKKKRETQINKARTDLSIVGVKGNVEMRNFSPFDDSPRDIASSYITQSIANVGGSVKLTGDFAPRRRTKTT
ncbi:1945_t:CDS:1, partial [Paraglomus occultum]